VPAVTTLTPGDIAIVHATSNGPDTFTFVLLRDIDAGTVINFTDNGWQLGVGLRSGEDTVSYTAASTLAAGTVITLSGLDLDPAGDQIIAYQGDATNPSVLYLLNFADGASVLAATATGANDTGLPPALTFGLHAVAVGFDDAVYAGPVQGSAEELFLEIGNRANWIESDAPPVSFTFNDRPTIDLDSNNSTHFGNDYETTVTSGGAGVRISDVDIDIDDRDDVLIHGAQINIIASDFTDDLLTIQGTLPIGIFAGPYDPGHGTIQLFGVASKSDYQSAIGQVVFSTTDTPRQLKSIEVNVFDGFDWSFEATAFVEVQAPLADAISPTLDLDANNSNGGGADYTATYVSGGPGIPIADTDLLITDPDSTTIASARIQILGWALQPGDLLSIAGTLPPGITASSFDPVTGLMTLSGTASLAAYQTALRQVVYSSTSPTPQTNDRGIQVTVNDGALESNIATTYMHVVVAQNAAPVLNLDANSSTTGGFDYLTTFTDGGPPVAIADSDVLITDADNTTVASATITITNRTSNDLLVFNGTPPAGITASSYDSSTGTLTLTGTASLAAYQTALRQVAYDNISTTPSTTTRIIDVVVSDGQASSNIAHAIVQVAAVDNNPPSVDLDLDNSTAPGTNYRATFIENGAPVAIADTDVRIADLDSTNLLSATLTVTNRQAGDLLSVIGALPGAITASTYDAGTGILTLSGNASLADFQTALRAIGFSTAGDDPLAGTRFIDVILIDSAGNAGQAAAALITVQAVNDAPLFAVVGNANYTENAGPLTLSPVVALSDADDSELDQVVVSIVDGSFAGDGDVLSIAGATSGVVSGITFAWDAASHTLVLSGPSLVGNYQTLLKTVAFHSTSENPTDFGASPTRTLTWTVSDGSTVKTVTSTVDIIARNDPPATTVAAMATYTENGGPLVVSPAATVTDIDSPNLIEGQVRIVDASAGDLLTVNGLQSGTFAGIDFSYDAALGLLGFTHPTSLADYQTFLRAIEFHSTSDDPTNSGLNPTRTLSWSVFDGEAFSPIQLTTITITALNDAPVNTVPGPQSAQEDTPLPIAGFAVDDVDSPTVTVTLSAAHGSVAIVPGLALLAGNLTAAATITGTLAEVNLALANVRYLPDPDFTGSDTLTMLTSDGALSDSDDVPITVTAVPDAPQLDLDGSAAGSGFVTTFTENGPAAALADSDLVLTDVDSPNLVGATFTLINAQAGDTLVVTGTLPGGITANPVGNQLILSGTASLADYATALALVAFDNPTEAPDPQDRLIEVTVNDGASTASAFTLVHVTALNDAPVAQDDSASGAEDI
jgi:hypothetical protein